jgi:prevent-host-death family protein
MKRVPATEFITKIGQYMEAAQHSPLAITSHGREKLIVMSPEEYRKLNQGREGIRSSFARGLEKPTGENALDAVLSIINTSTSVWINRVDLRNLLRRDHAQLKAHATLLIEEVSARLLATLVREGEVSWGRLYRIAEWVGTRDHEKKAFLRDMAGFGLGDTP